MKKLLIFVVLLLVVGMVSSCGIRTETSNYFYSPSWTRANSIIYIGQTSSSTKDILGSQLSSSYTEWVKTIYPAGTGESSVLWDATDKPPYAMTCSPVTDYVAYGDSLRSGLYRTLVIRNIAAGAHSGLDLVELAFTGVKSFDWNNDGTKLVYCTSTEVRTIDIDGANDALVTAESDLEFVSWKYGTRIVYVRTVGSSKECAMINSTGVGRRVLGNLDLGQVSGANTNEVYGVVNTTTATEFWVADVSGATTTLTQITAPTLQAVLPRLSPDATLFAYSKVNETSGVYTLNIGTGVETEVK